MTATKGCSKNTIESSMVIETKYMYREYHREKLYKNNHTRL